MRSHILVFSLFALPGTALPAPASALVGFDWVYVGDPGNPYGASCLTGSSTQCGRVSYGYYISTYEVTNAQYAEFLNAKAQSDRFELYDPNMATDPQGGIVRSGTVGGYSYAVKPGFANKPVNFVTYYDAVRFTNWLQNGQGDGHTEVGAYTWLLGNTPLPNNYGTESRHPDATVFLPSENEWFKAAYYNPVTGTYRAVPVGNVPSSSSLCAAPTSDPNRANCLSQAGGVTDVGAYPGSPSAYGTFDQGGNVAEWTDSLTSNQGRALRGGGWNEYFIASSDILGGDSRFGSARIGFRVASLAPMLPDLEVPEPDESNVHLVQAPISALGIDWMLIGAPGNAPNFQDPLERGAVPYNFYLSMYEVTNAQYAQFLNAKAATDPFRLYDIGMVEQEGGITRSGSSGSYAYAVKPGFANKPVINVSYFDAVRYANWLHNGMESGDTETGAYTLLGTSLPPPLGMAPGYPSNEDGQDGGVPRNPGAIVFVPNGDEWHKAAYYSPVTSQYYEYPTGSSYKIGCSSSPTGFPQRANCQTSISSNHHVLDVGSYPNSPSPFGTFDQGGNVKEWNEQLDGTFRHTLGGSYFGRIESLHQSSAESRIPHHTGTERPYIGIRLGMMARACGDGIDNDGDGLVDSSNDPGCFDANGETESPRCQNGIDDDGDGFVDFDGGASAGVAPEDETAPDPNCVDKAFRNKETPNASCGLGAELAVVLLAWRCARRGGRRASLFV